MMIDAGEGDFAMPPETIDIVANQNIYDLSTLLTYNPVEVRLVERIYTTEWKALDKWERNGGSIYAPGYSIGSFWPSYRFTGSNLVFNQIPNFDQDEGIRVEGYRGPDELVDDDDEPDSNFHEIYHNLLVLWATVSAIETKEATGMTGDPAMFRLRLEKMEERFIDSINQRSSARQYVDPFVVWGDE